MRPPMDTLAIAASGICSAEVRIAASAHNVANMLTSSFRPLRVTHYSLEGGGSAAHATQAPAAAEVDIAPELIDQMLAGVQFKGAARVFTAASETRGYLIDLFG